MNFRAFMQDNLVLFDGAFGTALQQKGMPAGELPELYNITRRELVREIHARYAQAGCDVATANTFGANQLKLEGAGYSVEAVIAAAVENARASGTRFVALDLGPIGQLMQPVGNLAFEDAVAVYRRQIRAGARAGADLILIETLADLYEAKAAVVAAKEGCDLPVICTMTYQADGRTFMGTDPVTAAVTLQGLGVDALGVNCSLGPEGLIPVAEQLLKYARAPVIVQANAGLPREEQGRTVYDISPEVYAGHIARMQAMGVRLFGGCCGTAPEHIREMKRVLAGKKPLCTGYSPVTACTSPSRTVIFDGRITVIGERINPTGKKKLKEALRGGDWAYVIGEAIAQAKAGSDVLDVNCGLPELDEVAALTNIIREVQAVTNLPLQIDSADPAALEAGVRLYNGKPVINSVNGDPAVMDRIFPIAKKYGALVIGLTLDEKGIPAGAAQRVRIARRILEKALEYGLAKEDLLIDCLVLTASAQQSEVMETLAAVRLVKEQLGLKTVLGVSNVSFGLPGRELINSAFLAAGFGAGLDAAILNPLSASMMQTVDAYKVLSAQDKDAACFLRKYTELPAARAAGGEADLKELIIDGKKADVLEQTARMLADTPPLEIIDRYFIPALDHVGERFERGELFLPQLMQSAESVRAGFGLVKDALANAGHTAGKGRIALATVKGDIHDIGKNIVKMLLENYGYQVIDLGKDVGIGTILKTVAEQDIRLVGLSALMTTTVKSMKETITALKSASPGCKVMVGGAVLNREYARDVGADYYARDARAGVRIAGEALMDGAVE